MGLTLNETKTGLKQARRETFDFPGYSFGPHMNRKTGTKYVGYSPSKKSVNRIKGKPGKLLDRRNPAPWAEVRTKLNQTLTGWKQYFDLGSKKRAHQAVDEYVYDRVRNFLRRRHKVSSQGTRQFPAERVFGALGVFRIRGPRAVRS
jgi:RNA-directed DNA polymerase